MAKHDRGKGGGKKKKPQRRPQRSAEFHKQFLPDAPPKRDYDPCPLSGEPIRDVLSAISHPQTGQPTNLESVIAELSRREQLGANERICYIGEGQFGVIQEQKVGGKQQITIIRRISYEQGNTRADWRKELSPGISRDYTPDPQPLSELYSIEEERQFPRFDRSSGSYMPRQS
jgi:hypothetical protein